MLKRLLLSLFAVFLLTGINAQEFTVWESRAEFPSDWSHYEIISADKFQQCPDFTTINIYYEDMFADGNSWATLAIRDSEWRIITDVTTGQGVDPDSGKKSILLSSDQSTEVLNNGMIMQGCGYTLVKITIEAAERPRYIHDMIWGENSGFEAPASGWQISGTHFASNQDFNSGINGTTAIRLTNTTEGEIGDNRFHYDFKSPLAPGEYKLQFQTRSDIDGASLEMSLYNTVTGTPTETKSITTGDQWQLVDINFTVRTDTELNALTINFGKDKASFYIDDLHFGPYLEEKPDINLLWTGNGQKSSYAGAIMPKEINPGDVIKLTFANDVEALYDNIHVYPVEEFWQKGKQIGVASIMLSDINDCTVEIGVTDEMMGELRSRGIMFELPYPGAAELVKIERVESAFNPNGMIAYGRRNHDPYNTHYIYTDMTGVDDKIAIMFATSPTFTYLSSGNDNSVSVGTHDTALRRVRADGSTVMVYYITPEIKETIKTTGHFTIGADADLLYAYSNPTMDVPVAEGHILWNKSSTFSNWESIRIPGGAFSHVSAGDKIYVHVEDAASLTGKSYCTISLQDGNWNLLEGYHLYQSDLSPDGAYCAALELDEESAKKVKTSGLIITGTGFRLSTISLESTAEPDDNIFYGFYQFYGTWDEEFNKPFTIPVTTLNAGDVVRLHYSRGVNSLNHMTPYTLRNSEDVYTIYGTVNWIMDYGYGNCYQDMGITEQFLETCNENVLLYGSYMINKVEILRDRFDPTDMLVYGTTEHENTNISVKIPENATALEISFTDVELNEPKSFIFIPSPGKDEHNITLGEESFKSSNGLATVTVDTTPDLVKMINEDNFGSISIKCNLPFRCMKAVVDHTLSIGSIDAGNELPIEYYNLQGVKVAEPSSGFYLRRQGNRTEKIFIK